MISTSATFVRLSAETNSTMFSPNSSPPGHEALTTRHETRRRAATVVRSMAADPSQRR